MTYIIIPGPPWAPPWPANTLTGPPLGTSKNGSERKQQLLLKTTRDLPHNLCHATLLPIKDQAKTASMELIMRPEGTLYANYGKKYDLGRSEGPPHT